MSEFICSCHNHVYNSKQKLHKHIYDYKYFNISSNKERQSQNNNKYYQKDRDATLKYMSKYYVENKQSRLKYMNNYCESHKEECHKRTQKWQRSSKGKICSKIYFNNRRTAQKNSSNLTIEKIQQTYEENIKKYKTLTCELCFEPIQFGEDSLEHFTPICRGKEFPEIDLNALNNLGVAHFNCNSSKKHRTLKEWFQLYPKYLEVENGRNTR